MRTITHESNCDTSIRGYSSEVWPSKIPLKVLVKDAWDEQVLVKDAWDETVPAHDEQELVKEAYDEVVKEAWDEEVVTGQKCKECGETKPLNK